MLDHEWNNPSRQQKSFGSDGVDAPILELHVLCPSWNRASHERCHFQREEETLLKDGVFGGKMGYGLKTQLQNFILE